MSVSDSPVKVGIWHFQTSGLPFASATISMGRARTASPLATTASGRPFAPSVISFSTAESLLPSRFSGVKPGISLSALPMALCSQGYALTWKALSYSGNSEFGFVTKKEYLPSASFLDNGRVACMMAISWPFTTLL